MIELQKKMIEIISILLIVFFLQQKAEIKQNDLLTIVLIIIFTFVIYDYLNKNKPCESFTSNNEPCNIKNIENLFKQYINKKENFTQLKEKFEIQDEEALAAEVVEDELYDKIAEELVEPEHIIEEQIIERPRIPEPTKQIQVVEAEQSLDSVVSFIEELENSSLTTDTKNCGLSNIAYSEYSNAGQYPNIYMSDTGLVHENYDEIDTNSNCLKKKASVFEVPRDATNDINEFKPLSKQEKVLSEKLWRCQNRLQKKCV